MPAHRRSAKVPVSICSVLRIQALTTRGLLSGPDGTVEGYVEIADPTDLLTDVKYGVRVTKRGRNAALSIMSPSGEQTIELFARPSPRGSGNPRWCYRCPCGAAANVLYLPIAVANRWACRTCWSVAYRSQLPPKRYASGFHGDQFAYAADFRAKHGGGS